MLTINNKISEAVKSVRERFGDTYPRYLAEKKSLISWIHEDILHSTEDIEKIERIVNEIIRKTDMGAK